jgi:hypothetical protein
MIRRLAISTALASMLGACATTHSGYYTPGHDGYGDYYYDNPQVIVDEHYAPYWDGPYWGGYYGFGYGLGYFPGDCFGFQYGYASGFCGYYDPWLYGGYYRHHHHGHGHDPHDNAFARNDGTRREVQQFSQRNGVLGASALRAPDPSGHMGAFGDARMQSPNAQSPNAWEPRRESRQDFPHHHRDADGGNH